MKPKKAMMIILALLVVATALYVEESGAETDPLKKEGAKGQASGAPEKVTGNHDVIAYYFHGNQRCRTCKTIEAYAEEAIRTGFAEEIKDGRLKWKAVNIDEQENEHYVQDFQLVTRSLVLQEKVNDAQERWKNLPRIWELVRNKEAFQEYVQEETRAFLEGRDQ